jgi:peptidyl-prolyl cis-trans isomerase C
MKNRLQRQLHFNHSKENIIMARAKARHILVPGEEQCLNLKAQIEAGEDFAAVAQAHSQCPSGKQGGDLGEFGRGQMVPEFDEAVFTGEVGTVLGPIKTQFGYHLLEVTERS